MSAGAAAFSSSLSKNGLITACGHTIAHWLHWIHLAESHSGTLTAIPLFSKAAVPASNVPSSIPTNVETGRLSPSNLFIGITTSLTNLVACLIGATSSSLAFFHESGTLTSTTDSTPLSIAALFMLTTFSPFLP